MPTFWRNKRPVRTGLIVSGLVLASSFAAIVGTIALSYGGECGGFFPFLAGPRPCTFLEYLSGTMAFTVTIIVVEFWWIIAPAAALPIVAGVLVDRFRPRGRPRSRV